MLLCLFSMFSILLVLLDGILHEASVTHGINWPTSSLERRTLKAHEMSNERSFREKERCSFSLLIFGQR